MASHDQEQHCKHLQQVFTRLVDHGLQVNPAKCILGAELLYFLVFHVDKNGIRPLDTKVQVIWDFPLPTTQRKLRRFLGLVNFITVLYLHPPAPPQSLEVSPQRQHPSSPGPRLPRSPSIRLRMSWQRPAY